MFDHDGFRLVTIVLVGGYLTHQADCYVELENFASRREYKSINECHGEYTIRKTHFFHNHIIDSFVPVLEQCNLM